MNEKIKVPDTKPEGWVPWGLGGKVYREPDGSVNKDYGYGYGMGGRPPMDPHDFSPDGIEDGTTKKEMKAWEDAKAACNCGQQ